MFERFFSPDINDKSYLLSRRNGFEACNCYYKLLVSSTLQNVKCAWNLFKIHLTYFSFKLCLGSDLKGLTH